MNNNMNKEVEESLGQALSKLKDEEREKEEKRYKKLWGKIKVPFTLHEGLGKYTKAELDLIRKTLDIKNASGLKKAELIEVLQQQIPEILQSISMLWDKERFTLLATIASNNGVISVPKKLGMEQVEYLRSTGLIYSGTLENEQVLTIPEELIEPIKALNHDLSVRAVINRNTEWIKLTSGLLYYYGTLTESQLIQMIEKHIKGTINNREYVDVIQNANDYIKRISINKDGFSNNRVFDPEKVMQEHQARSTLPYYQFSKQQLLTAGEPGYVEKDKYYMQLVSFLATKFQLGQQEADGIVEECVYAIRIGQRPNEVLTWLSYQFELNSVETLQSLTDKIIQLMNNTREWFLKGYTPKELGEQERTSDSTKKSNPSNMKKKVKVGRNEPCPCGSGNKYKKCCGR